MAAQDILVSCLPCNPCEWIKAIPCPDMPAGLPDVYILKAVIPAGTWVFGLNVRRLTRAGWGFFNGCYTIDSAGAVVNPAHSKDIISIWAWFADAQLYDSCSDCNPPGGPPGGGGGGAGGGGGGGTGGGGGGGGDPGGGGEGGGGLDHGKGWLATKCTGTGTDDDPGTVWVSEYPGITKGTIIFRYGTACYSVDTSGDATAIPDGAKIVGVWGNFDSCADCAEGYPIYPCPGQDGDAAGKIIYIRESSLSGASGQHYFRLDGVCYFFDADEPGEAEAIPPNSHVITALPNQYEACEDCVMGVVAELCDPDAAPDDAPVIWIPREALPGATLIFRYQGLCYTIDPGGTQQASPAGAITVQPTDDFPDCDYCLCGEPGVKLGVQAKPCAGQSAGGIADSVWVVTPDVWADDSYFIHGGVCWFIAKGTKPQRIPAGGRRIPRPSSTFQDCLDCLSSIIGNPPPPPGGGGGGGGGGGPWPPIGFPPPIIIWPPGGPVPPGGGGGFPWPPPGGGGPPRPPVPPAPPPAVKSNELKRCDDGTLTGQYISTAFGLAGKIIQLIGDASQTCYEVVITAGDHAGDVFASNAFAYCLACENSKKWLPLVSCADGTPSGKFVRKLDWIAGGGAARPVLLTGGVCYTVGAETTTNPGAGNVISGGTRLASCADPACGNCYCWRPYKAVWDCAASAWYSSPPYVDGDDECGDGIGHSETWEYVGDEGGDPAYPIFRRWVRGQACNDICGEGCLQTEGDPPTLPITGDGQCCALCPGGTPSAVVITLDSESTSAIAVSDTGGVCGTDGIFERGWTGGVILTTLDGACVWEMLVGYEAGGIAFKGTRPKAAGIVGSYTKTGGDKAAGSVA